MCKRLLSLLGCEFGKTAWRGVGFGIGTALILSSCTAGQRIEDNAQYPIIGITPELIAQQTKDAAIEKPTAPAPKAEDYAYRIGPGDVLQLRLWDGIESPNPHGYSGVADQPFTIKVEEGGNASFPYIGTLNINQKTTAELRTELTEKLSKYFRAPRFEIQLQEFRSQNILVSGAVVKPGPLYLGYEPLDVAKALEKAGGPQPYADLEDALIVHPDNKREHVDLLALLYRADNAQNHTLQAGDTLLLTENHRNRVFLMGEALKTGALYIKAGRMTLTEALNDAQGPDGVINSQGPNNISATAGNVYVIRGALTEADIAYAQANGATGATTTIDQNGKPIIIYRLNTDVATSYILADQFLLKPRDVVYIAAAPITEWHRFVSQLIPSGIGVSKTIN